MGRERGATLAEYALLVALIAVVSIGALTLLGDRSSDEFEEIATSVGEDTRPSTGSGGSGGGGGGGGGTTTTTASGGGGGTTTTAPTTTTTAPTTTTTVPPLDGSYPDASGFASDPEVDHESDGDWTATVDLVLRNTAGDPMPYTQANVRIWRRERQWDGSYDWEWRMVQVTTGANGTVQIQSNDWPESGSRRVIQLVFVVEDAGGSSWDGNEGYISVTP